MTLTVQEKDGDRASTSAPIVVRPRPEAVFVDPAWAGLAPGTDPDGPGPALAIGYDAFATAQQSIDAVAPGGTVRLAAGTYPENLVLDKSIHLTGSGAGTTILLGQGAGTGLTIRGAGADVRDLTVRGYAVGLSAGPGTHFVALTEIRLTGNAAGGSVAGVETVLVAGGDGDKTVYVTATRLARGGDDALDHSGVQYLTIDAGTGSNRLVVQLDDQAAPQTVWVNGVGVARDHSPFLLFYRSTGGSFAGGVDVVLGGGNDVVIVQGQAAGAPLHIAAGAGDDTFHVAVTAASAYHGLTLDGGPGNNTLKVFDLSGGAVMHDLPSGPSLGVVATKYLGGADSRIDYQTVQSRFTSVGPEASFIQALYNQVLGFKASAADIAFWRGVFEQSGRGAVTDLIEQSAPARSRLVAQWYQQYLGYVPDPLGAQYWTGRLREGSQEGVLADLLGTPAYYLRAGGSDPAFVARLYQDLLSHPPSDGQLGGSLDVLTRSPRSVLARLLLTSQEYLALTVSWRYRQLLHQTPSAADLLFWGGTGLSQQQLDQVLESSDAFFDFGG